MQQCDIGYFDLTIELEEGFINKRGDVQERTEKLSIVKFKTTGQRRPPKYQAKPALGAPDGPAGLLTEGPTSPTTSTDGFASPSPALASASTGPPPVSATPKMAYQQSSSVENPPPPYSAGLQSPPLKSPKPSSLAAVAAAKAKPPPPKPKPSRLSGVPAAETVTALYDYSAQAEGDLSFRAGDVIEIVTRTQNDNEWWIGKLHGKSGQFPGKYTNETLQS